MEGRGKSEMLDWPKKVRAVHKNVAGSVWDGEEGQGQEETNFAEVMTNDCSVSALFSLN